MQSFLRFAPTAAFWILALAAQVSGYTNAALAIGLAVAGSFLLLWPAGHYVTQWWGHKAQAPEDNLVPLAVAVRRFHDAVPDVFPSYIVEATNRTVDQLMGLRAHRLWRLVPILVKRRDSDRHQPLKFEDRGTQYVEFKNETPGLVGMMETVSTDLAVRESDLRSAIARAPLTPPGGELIPLKEAVKFLFDGARNNVVISFADVQETEDDKLAWLANEIWNKVPLQVRFAISNTYEPLSKDKREERYLVFRESAPLLVYDYKTEEQIAARDIAVLQHDLNDAISKLKESGRKGPAPSE